MNKNCAYCRHGEDENNFMHYCMLLKHYVVADRRNKTISYKVGKQTVKEKICRAEELSMGEFEFSKTKYKKSNHE